MYSYYLQSKQDQEKKPFSNISSQSSSAYFCFRVYWS